jgi:hypoxanthine-DNA glycosylase
MGEELHALPYEDRLKRLAEHRIGLWDVIQSASRPGSLDQAIREAAHNRIEHLLHDYPDLQAIAFNGSTAAAAGRKLVGDPPARLALLDLPSSSAANTRPFAEKARAWAQLREFVQP